MSRSLSIECEWIDQPAAADPLERLTWADLRIRTRGRTVTRIWDRLSQAERTSIFVPVFPLANWIVRHWWALLYETNRWEEVPSADWTCTPQQREWLRRHCWRAAESGLLLPRLCLFGDSEQVCVAWDADSPLAYPHMPAEFLDSGRIWLPRADVVESLREFVRTVLERMESSTDARVAVLRENWAAIQHAGPEESSFCRSAGRLGLDPYSLHEWEPALVVLLETGLGLRWQEPIATDFLEAVEPTAQAPDVWRWIESASSRFDLRPAGAVSSVSWLEGEYPANCGYRLAADVRQRLGNTNDCLPNLQSAAEAVGIGSLNVANENQLPDPRVRAVVGWQAGRQPVVVGPLPARLESQRFLQSRALFLLAYTCHEGPRLTTTARTWSQQASRAFAAELLAPQTAVVSQWNAGHGDVDVRLASLAAHFQVSSRVIELQLRNARVEVLDECA